ncbi:replication fork protection component Swi3-domain-containing protein [Dissophora ornata]|nr:chromosome segregation in meiosis- protein [Dissophora ornata]KAI8603765.1 replication fork protection component Swi3-domain-containing protein [Dissophora ornata]
MDDIRLEDEPFEPFDDYEDYADQMMQEAERQDQLMINSASTSASASVPRAFAENSNSSGALPQQRDYLGMFHTEAQAAEQEFQRVREQHQKQLQQQQQLQQPRRQVLGQLKGNQGAGRGSGSRPIGSTDTGDDGTTGDLAAVKITKKRVKQVTLDNDRLLSEQGLSLLMSHGKRLKIRHKYKDTAEKNSNSRQNLADLMRLYQTWAHNLFPKATFKDFITQAESKCKDRQIKSTMDGWRDAYWSEVRAKKYSKEEADRTEQESQDRQNGVWEEHEKEMALGSAEAMVHDDIAHNGEPSSSTPSSTRVYGASSSSSAVLSKPIRQPRPRPAASRKGKEKAIDNPSAAMRLAASDDDEDGQQDYEEALDRMRTSMNLDNRASDVRISQIHAAEDGGGYENNEWAQEMTRKNEIDLDNYNSDVEDEEEEEEAPLFTHRALQMMGGVKALEGHGKSASSKEREDSPALSEGDVNMEQIMNSPAKSNRANETEGLRSGDVGEDDDDNLLSRQRPARVRRAILLSDSDDE